jgi:type I restriction enzyme S subunit
VSEFIDLVSALCPKGVEFQTLGTVGRFVRGGGLQKSDLTDSGFPAIHYGQIHTHYGTWATQTQSFVTEEMAERLRKAEPGDLVVVTTSEDDEAVGKAVAWLGPTSAAVSGDAYIYRHTLAPKFASYFFQSKQFQTQKRRNITGTKVRRISGDSLAKIRIPVPPLAVQEKVVELLDQLELSNEQLGEELQAEAASRRRQYVHYRNFLLTFPEDGARKVPLGDICVRVSSGATPLVSRSAYYEGGHIPWLRTQEVVWRDIYATEMKITEEALRETAVKWIPENCVIVAISGASAARAALNKIPLTTNQHCCNLQIDPQQANYRYVFHWITAKYEELKALGRGARSDLSSGLIKSFPIALPSLQEQTRIADQLDELDNLDAELSSALDAERAARRRQYEYYRERLLTFDEALS